MNDLTIVTNYIKNTNTDLKKLTQKAKDILVLESSTAIRKENLSNLYKDRALKILKILNSSMACIHRSKTVLSKMQVKTVEHFDKKTDSLLVVFGTGLGKTLTALSASQCYLDEFPENRVIVISPASLINNFRKEMIKYGGEITQKYEFYSFEGILSLYKKGTPVDCSSSLLIIDEVHNLRNYRGIKFDAVLRCAKKSQKRLLLTATPIVNDYKDMISIINLLYGDIVIQTKEPDTERIEKAVSKGKYIPLIDRVKSKWKWNIKGIYNPQSNSNVSQEFTNCFTNNKVKLLNNRKFWFLFLSYYNLILNSCLIDYLKSYDEQMYNFILSARNCKYSDSNNCPIPPEKFIRRYRKEDYQGGNAFLASVFGKNNANRFICKLTDNFMIIPYNKDLPTKSGVINLISLSYSDHNKRKYSDKVFQYKNNKYSLHRNFLNLISNFYLNYNKDSSLSSLDNKNKIIIKNSKILKEFVVEFKNGYNIFCKWDGNNIEIYGNGRKLEYYKSNFAVELYLKDNIKHIHFITISENPVQQNIEIEDSNINVEIVNILDKNFTKILKNKVAFAKKSKSPDFPDYKFNYKYVKMSKEYEKRFNEVLDKQIQNEEIIFKSPETFFNGFRRAVNSAGDDYFSEKLTEVLKIIKDNSGNISQTLIYSTWLEFGIEKMKKILEQNNISYDIVQGSTPTKKRDLAVKMFNNKEIKVLMITKAGSEGLDLKETRNVFVLDPPWNPSALEQIVGRAIRYKSHAKLPLQERFVNIYFMILVENDFNKEELTEEGYKGRSGDYLLYTIINNKRQMVENFENYLKQISIKLE